MMHRILLMFCMFAVFCTSAEQSETNGVPVDTDKILQEPASTGSYHFSTSSLINLEKLFEDNPDLAETFSHLSEEEQRQFIEIVELLSTIFSKELESLAEQK